MNSEEMKHNPYVGEDLMIAQQQYNPGENKEFESRFTVGGKDKRTIVAESNEEIQRLLTAYLKRVGEKRSQDAKPSQIAGAEAFISFIKNTCIDIIRSKCAIRQSLQYMYEIMESKPVDSALDAKGKELWDSLKDTLKTLSRANSKMLDVSHKYFGFLLKFWEALGEFCRQQVKLNPPPMEISIGPLNKHLYDFIKFKQSYDEAITKVDEAAENGLKLFDKYIGGTAIADAFKSLKQFQKQSTLLIDELKQIKVKSMNNIHEKRGKIAANKAQIAMNAKEIEYHKGIYKSMKEWQEKEEEAVSAEEDKMRKAEEIKAKFTKYKMDYHERKKNIDKKATNLRLKINETANKDQECLERRKKQISQDLRRDKQEASKLNEKAQQLYDKAATTKDRAVKALEEAKDKNNYETREHSGEFNWCGWNLYHHSWKYQIDTRNADKYIKVAEDLNRQAKDTENEASRLNDKACAMKKDAIKRADMEAQYEQKQFEQSLRNKKKILELSTQINNSAQVESVNAKIMANEELKQEEKIKLIAKAKAEREAKLQQLQKLTQHQQNINDVLIGELEKKNAALKEDNEKELEAIDNEEKDFKLKRQAKEEDIKLKHKELKKVNESISNITKQIGINGKDQLIDFANMTMEIFPNLQNVKDGAAALKVGFEDFALILSLRINSQITIGWYFQITSIFDRVACDIIANALNRNAFYKMNDLNYYDQYGEKKAIKKFEKNIAPIIRDCMRIKGDTNNKNNDMMDREGIDDNKSDDEKSSLTETNTPKQTLNPLPKFIEAKDQKVIDNHVKAVRKLFVNKENIYGKKEYDIKGWMELSKIQAKENRVWILGISPLLCYFFNNMSSALKFSMNQIVMESYRRNESRIKSITTEIKQLLQKEVDSKLPVFKQGIAKADDTWINYLIQWNLAQYKDKFIEFGYTDPSIWWKLSDKEMKDDLGFKKGDIWNFTAKIKKEIAKGGDDDKPDDTSSKKEKKGKSGKKGKRVKRKRKKDSSSDESSSDESSDTDDDDSDSSSDHDRRKSKKKSKKSKDAKKKKKRKKRDESSSDDEDESSESDDDESSSDDSRYKKRKKQQNKKKGKKKKNKKKSKGKKKKRKKKSSSEEEEDENTESDDDSKDESDSDKSSSSSSSDNESKKKKKKKNKKKDKVKIKKQNKKKSKKKKKRKESTDESESGSGSGSGLESNGSSSSSESEEKPKKKSKGKKDRDTKKSKKGKKSKKSKSKKKVSDDEESHDDESDESGSD